MGLRRGVGGKGGVGDGVSRTPIRYDSYGGGFSFTASCCCGDGGGDGSWVKMATWLEIVPSGRSYDMPSSEGSTFSISSTSTVACFFS